MPARVVLFIAVTWHSQKTSLVLPTETQEIHAICIKANFYFPTDLSLSLNKFLKTAVLFSNDYLMQTLSAIYVNLL